MSTCFISRRRARDDLSLSCLKTHKVGDTQLCGASSPLIMSFNLLSLLVLKFRGRSVAVFRDHCTRYEVSRPTINFRV